MPRNTATPVVDEAATEAVSPVSDAVEAKSVGPSFADAFAKASLPFNQTFKRQIRGGRILDYITGEQALSRIQEAYGDWDWSVGKPLIEGKDVLISGTLTVKVGNAYVSRDGVGGATNNSGDLGNTYKAAETAAFKRAAAKFGVGLYLYEKSDEGGEAELPQQTWTPRPAPQGLPPVQFGNNNSNGAGTTGPIEAVSPAGGISASGKPKLGGLKVQGQWYNVSSRTPIDVSQYQRGQVVTIQHQPGTTFIDGVVAGDNGDMAF